MTAQLFEIDFPYGTTFTPAEQQTLSEYALSPLKFQADGALDWGSRTVTVAAQAMGTIVDKKPTIVRVISNKSTQLLAEFATRTTTVVNERCNVAVSGLGMLTINEVQNHNDLCTDKLQKLLEEGWRIVAVCVQPDQRRPDYILGRTKTNIEE